MIMLKSGHFKLGGPSSEQCGRFDLQESKERMKKKPKLTGHGWKSKYKRMREEEIVPVESALDKSERVVDQVREERVHSPPSKMTCHPKKKDVPCSDGINYSGRDLVLGEQDMSKEASEVDGRGNGNLKKKMKEVRCSVEKNDSGRDLELGKQDMSKEASKVDGRGNGKSTIRDNSTSANEVHYKDRDHIPLKQKIKLEDESAGRDTDISVEDVQRKCVKRMKKLVKKQKAKIEEFHRTWEGIFSELEGQYKLDAAIIRSIYLASEFKVTDKLEISESDFAKKRAEKNLEKDMQLKELEAEQLAARNEEIRKADIWLAEAKARISGIADGSSKAQSSGSQNVETSKGSELKVRVGTKDIVPSTQKHGENIDPDCGNDEDVTRNKHNKNPSIELKISPRNEGEIGRKTTGGGISSSDTQKPDISQPKHSGDIPLEFPETVAEEIVNDTIPVNMSTNILIEGIANTLIEGIAEVNALDLPNADNSGRHGRISHASGESVLHDVQSVELHGDVPSKLPETVANENLDVDDVQSAELHGEVLSELPETVANENSDIDDVQSFELHGDLPSELPETVATENLDVDDVQSVELHEDVPSELPETVANENLDIDDVQSFELHGDLSSELPETVATENLDIDDVQLVEMHGDVPSELPETEANENLDNANMMDSSNQTPNALFGKRDAIDLPDDEHLAQQKHFGSDGMHKGPTEPAEPVANEIVDIVNPEELSAKLSTEGFGEAGALHLSDASLSRSDETDRTTVDDHVSDGHVLETSEQTETFRHPCPLVPLQVQEVQNVVSVAVQVHDAGMINSSPSEIFVSKLVANSISNIEPQACEEPAIETQSSSTTAVSTSKIIDTVITEQSSLKSHGHDESIAKDKVTSQIEVTDLEIVDTAAPVSTSEEVDTAETLQSVHDLQEQVEPSTETRSMIEVTVSQNLSNAEEQVEDASTAVNDVSLEIGVSNAGITDNSTPVQSHIDAPPLESFSELPLIDLESQNHNMESNPSKAVDTFELPHDSVSQLLEDVLRVINPLDAGPENQSSPATSVQAFPSSQNYASAEGVSQLTSHQADALNPLSLIPDPLMYELERNQREAGALQRSHQETLSGLKSEYEKEKEELIAQVKRKYKLKVDDAIAQYALKKDELYQSWKKIVMNKSLADAFRFNSLGTSAWPLTQQGISASSMQCHQQSVRPTAPDPQSSCVIGQPLQQASVPHAPTFSHVTSQTGQSVQQAPVTHATRPAPTTNQHSAAQSVPHATGFNPVTSRNGQAMQPVPHATRPAPTTNQHSVAQSVPHATGFNPVTSRNGQAMQPVPHATRLEPFLNQNFAAQSVQAAQQGASTAATISNLRGMNSVTHFGQNFQSSPFLQASTPAAASSMTSTNYLQNLWNLRQQQQLQQLQQQILAAQQWPSNSQNFQHLGYPPSLSHHNLNPLQVLAQNHRNLGDVQGNWNSCGGAASAICLSDDD